MITAVQNTRSPDPKEVDDFDTIDTKTQEATSSMWSSLNPMPMLKKYAVKAIVPVWQYASGFDVDALQEALYKDCEDLNGKMVSTAPTVLIDVLSTKLVEGIQKRSKENHSFYSFSEEELNALKIVINVTLIKILLNLHKYVKISGNPITNIFQAFAQLAQNHFPPIAAQLSSIRGKTDKREQAHLLKGLFASLSFEFFKMAFPNGKKDLPLPYPVQDIAWEILKGLFYQDIEKPQDKRESVKSFFSRAITPADLIPQDMVFALYDLLMKPLEDDGTKELSAVQGGEFWLQVSQFIANKTADHVPGMLSRKKTELAYQITDFLEIPDLERENVETMLAGVIGDFGREDKVLTPIWQFISRYLASSINHRMIALQESNFNDAKKLFGYIKNEVMPAVMAIEADPCVESRRVRMHNIFERLADRLVIFSGFNRQKNLRVPFFKKQLVSLLELSRKQFLPGYLYDCYCDLTKPQRNFPELDRRLKVLFFDEEFALAHLSSEERGVSLRALFAGRISARDELWAKSGITELSQQLEQSFSLVSRAMGEVLRNYLKGDSVNAAQLLIDFLPKKRLGETERQWVGMMIEQAVCSGDPFVEEILRDVGIIMERALLHVFVYIGEHTEKVIAPIPGEHSQKYFLANMTIRLLGVIHRHPNITIQVEQSQDILNPEEKQQRLRKIFEPLAREFLQVGMENPMDDLPMVSSLKGDFWEAIQTKIVPDLLEKIYRRLNFWQSRTESSKQLLRQVFGTSHPEEASRVIAHFGAEYIPFYLTFAHDAVALKLKQQAEEWFREDPQIVSYLQGHQDGIVKLLASNIQQYGESLTPAVQANKPFTTKLIDGLVLKVMGKFAQKVDTKERGTPNFMGTSFVDLLQVTANHFTLINQVTRNNQLDHAWNVTYEQMVAGFGNQLHPGIPQPHVSKEEQARHRMDHFYRPVTKRLFRLLDLENDPEFNVFLDSEPMRKLWTVVQDQLFPSLMQSLFEKLMEPHTIRTMLLNSLETLNSALNAIPEQQPQAVDNVPNQPELNEACGRLVLQLLGLIPRTMAHSVFEIDRVQKLAAQNIGSAISKTLRQWTWIKIMDKSIYSGLPSFRMGRWEGAEKVERFVPLKIIAGEVVEPDQLTFNFPKTEQGKALLEAKRQSDEHNTELRLKHLMAVMTSRQIQSTIESIVSKYWNIVQSFIDEKIQLYFGLVGLKAKEFLDIVCGLLVFELLAPIVQFALTPFSMMFWYLLETYLAARADDLSKDAIHRIQENLFFGLMDKFLDNFEGPVPA